MLEIFFVVFMCRKIGTMMRAKGRSAGGYQFMLVAFWFGGEITGAIVGAVVLAGGGSSGGFNGGAYLCALVGAAVGAGIVFLIVNSVSSLAQPPFVGGFPVMPPGAGYPPQQGYGQPGYPPQQGYAQPGYPPQQAYPQQQYQAPNYPQDPQRRP